MALIWNVRDPSDPLQARISEILAPLTNSVTSHQDMAPPDLIAASGLFGPVDERTWPFQQRLSRAHLIDRIASTSYVAVLDPDSRADVLSQVLEAADGLPEPISIPYRTEVFVADRL